jgi:UDP-glucose 4-epimerase
LRILITGASGFLGSWFLNHYVTRTDGDYDVHYMDILPHPAGLPMDIEDMEAWLADFDQDVDIAFHFAAPVGGRMKIEFDPLYNADALRLDSVFFRWAAKHAKLAVYPSSSAVYPISMQGKTGYFLLQEGMFSPRNPNWSQPDELYGLTKLVGEYLAMKAWDQSRLNTLILRPFSGYGPGQTLDYPVPAILRRALLQQDPLEIWGSGDQTRDFVYVTDIVGATMARIEKGVEGVDTMNISSGWGTSFRQVAEIAARLAGYSPQIMADEGRPEGVVHRRGDNQRMLRYWRPEVQLAQGLRWTMDSLKEGLVVKGGPEVVRA